MPSDWEICAGGDELERNNWKLTLDGGVSDLAHDDGRGRGESATTDGDREA